MEVNKNSSHSRWLKTDPNDPSLNPGHLSTMTWNPEDAISRTKKAFGTPLFKSLAQLILEKNLLDSGENGLGRLRAFIKENGEQFAEAGITLHPASFLLRNSQIHGLATLGDGQFLFFSYFRGNPPPLKALLYFEWNFVDRSFVRAQASPVDLVNLRIFLEKIGPEFAPVAPRRPGVGLGNRMSTLDYPVAYEIIGQYGLCAGVIQASVFREMIPEKMFRGEKPPLIDLPGVGLIPAGHTGSSIQGQFVTGIVYRIQRGITLPMIADADHIPVKGSSEQALEETRMLIEEAQDRTLFTLDPHFCLYGGNPTLQFDPILLEEAFKNLSCERQKEILGRYVGRSFQIDHISGEDSFSIHMSREEVVETSVRFEEALKAISATCSMIEEVKGEKPYAVEVSIDEAPGMTEPHHFFYLASEIAHRNIKLFSLAPGLGFTKRDLDVEESKGFFEEQVGKLASIAHRFGAVLGIHSGDGKGFATRRILARATCGRFWYKVSPDRQRNLFKALSKFPRGSFERNLYEDIFDWTLCYVLRLSLKAEGETKISAEETIEEVLGQETATAHELRRRIKEAHKRLGEGEKVETLLAELEAIVRSPNSDLIRDPNSRLIHDFAFVYVGQRDAAGHFLHRGRFFAISDEATETYRETDRTYLQEMLEALELA